MPHRTHRRLVAAFDTTHEALTCEATCKQKGVAGRIIPTPTAIRADCGLAWAMPPEERAHFEEAAEGHFSPSGLYELDL